MYLSKEQALGIFLKLKPSDADEGKAAKETASSLFRFLAFDHLCKTHESVTVSFPSVSFPSDQSDPDYCNRQELIESYAFLGTLQDEKGNEIALDCFGKLDFERGRTAKQKVGNDFLTAQLKQAQDTVSGRDYPHRPSHLLHLGGSNTWAITKHIDWQKNLVDFIGPKDSMNWSYAAQFMFRNTGSKIETVKASLRSHFTTELADHWINNLNENYLILGTATSPVADSELVAAMRPAVDIPTPEIKIKPTAVVGQDLADILDQFEADLSKSQVLFNQTLPVRLTSSLNSKPFLILTGLSGSGKTKLAQAFAQWITPKPSEDKNNPHVALIPVGADWMGNENILGYPNGLESGKYISTKALELILHAKDNEKIPHFLILDEMNLSHVERYFADMLSAIESEEEIPLYQGADRKAHETDVPASLKLPKNLFIIGTVNVDETTYMFSPKVLDRANVIEFRMNKEELTKFLDNPVKPDLKALAGKGESYGEKFVNAAKDHEAKIPVGVKELYTEEMEIFFRELSKEGAEFGYRTAYEAARFMHFYQVLGNHDANSKDWFNGAFDAVIIQKFLPKLHGSNTKLSSLLKELWILCHEPAAAKGEVTEGDDGPVKKDETTAKSEEELGAVRYPMSAAKIARMRRVLDRNGFVSFAEA